MTDKPKSTRARANRLPSRGPASKGNGWGGEAKGAGAPMFVAGNQAAAGPHDMLTDAVRAQKLRDELYTIATTSERDDTRVSASVALLNRIEGMPVARNLNINRDAEEVEDTRPSIESLIEKTLKKDRT